MYRLQVLDSNGVEIQEKKEEIKSFSLSPVNDKESELRFVTKEDEYVEVKGVLGGITTEGFSVYKTDRLTYLLSNLSK